MKLIIIFLSILSFQNAFCFALERPINMSSEFSGAAGIGASLTSGSEAIFYNPAGLATGESNDVSLGSSFVNNKSIFKKITLDEDKSRTNNRMLFDSVFTKHKIGKNIGLGFGQYLASDLNLPMFFGGDIEVNGISFSRESRYIFSETAVGFGISINERVSVGAVFRHQNVEITQLRSFSSNSIGETSVRQFSLSGTGNGFRLGIQFKSVHKRMGFGISYRSKIEIDTEGTLVRAFEDNSDPDENSSSSTSISELIDLGTSFSFAFHKQFSDESLLLLGLDILSPKLKDGFSSQFTTRDLQKIVVLRIGTVQKLNNNLSIKLGFLTNTNSGSGRDFIPDGFSNTVTAGLSSSMLDDKLIISPSITSTWLNASQINVTGLSTERFFNQKIHVLSGHFFMKFLF